MTSRRPPSSSVGAWTTGSSLRGSVVEQLDREPRLQRQGRAGPTRGLDGLLTPEFALVLTADGVLRVRCQHGLVPGQPQMGEDLGKYGSGLPRQPLVTNQRHLEARPFEPADQLAHLSLGQPPGNPRPDRRY